MKQIKLNEIEFKYGEKKVLKGLDLTCVSGDAIAIVGDNGVGKSTLLYIIAGFYPKYTGKIEKTGIDDIFGIIEQPCFWNNLTGYENLEYYLGEGDYNEEIAKWGMSEDIHKPVKKYSLGMKQKLALILTFCANPDIYVLDEPTNALDQSAIDTFNKSITEAKAKGKIIIMATHLLNELTICDKVFLMSDGKLELDLKEEVNKYSLVYAFEFVDEDGVNNMKSKLNVSDILEVSGNRILVTMDDKNPTELLKLASQYGLLSASPIECDLKKVYSDVNGRES